jgi:hypothetical protein
MSVANKGFGAEKADILKALATILESAPLRTSKQCQDLLRYVVEHSLREDNEALKERVIGCEVFGRRPDYDAAEDPVVRVRAGDLRKRLALFYRSMPPNVQVELDIPHGSYRVEFHPISQPGLGQNTLDSPPGAGSSAISASDSTPEQNVAVPAARVGPPVTLVLKDESVAPASVQSRRPRWFFRYGIPIIGTLAAIAALLLGANRLLHPPMSTFDSFWNPVVSSSTAPVICIGSAGVYRYKLSEEYGENPPKRSAPAAKSPDQGYVVNYRPGQQINMDDLILDRTNWVGVGDAAAIASVVSMLSSAHKTYDLRFSEEIVFKDLRQSPTILIGAFNNSWTMEMDDKLPFVFDQVKYIREIGSSGRSWSTVRDSHGRPTEDYALVSRVLHSKTGAFSITLAGIDMAGTRAAAEFVSDQDHLNQALKLLPPGWQGKNLQLLLHTNVINGLPSAPDVVAYRIW